MRALLFPLLLVSLMCALVAPAVTARTIEFETTQVTEPDVALSPDGQWLIFTMLGHLFRLPVTGGTAEQLTFGPYYDTDPVFSPDGKRVAFVSDRDGSEGNIFVLELATGKITQVTKEPWAARPTWSPDGEAIVYLRLVREVPGVVPQPRHSRPETVPALVRQVTLSGGEPQTLSAPPRLVGSVFYLSDGRLSWTVIELVVDPETLSVRATTRVEAMTAQGAVFSLRTLMGYAAPVVPSPAGDGFYCRRYRPGLPWYNPPAEDLVFLPFSEGVERLVLLLSGHRGWVPRFAVAPDNRSLFLGEAGRLWKIALPSGAREHIPFRARVKLDIQDPLPPPKWTPATLGSSAPPHSILDPRLSPDGRTVVFGAAGYLWQQPVDGGPAKRLFEGSAFEQAPALSPDGRELAFVLSQYGKEEIRVLSLDSRQTHTLDSGSIYYWDLSWSSDGQRLVFAEYGGETDGVMVLNLGDGKKQKITDLGPWDPRPHFSSDGQWLYFSANPTGTGTLYRLPLAGSGRPEPVTQLSRHLSAGLVSPDGKWLAFRRNKEIWVAPLRKEPVKEEDVRQLSAEGGETFAFTPDSSAVIYAAGNRVWRHPLAGGDRREIPIQLELRRLTPPPLLVRQVRVLDFKAGGFSRETSLFIERGRIRWIGSERGRNLPRETMTLNAEGRFAIPGLFDSHSHASWDWASQAAFLAYGVTSVRDPGGSLAYVKALADRADATGDPVPRYFFSGEIFDGAQPYTGDSFLQIHNPGEARTYVLRWKEWDAQFIKVYPSLSWPLQRVVAEEARRQGLPVVGHGAHVEEITKSVTLGFASLEHITEPPRDDVLQLLAAAGTRWDPTLSRRGGNTLLLRDEPERLTDVKLRAFILGWHTLAAQDERDFRAITSTDLRGRWALQLASVRAAHQRGVKLLAGTDNGFYGVSLHWELEYLVQAGIPRLEVLRIATQQAAEAVGAEDDLGTLEPGKLTDLVLLDRNPLEDIKNTQTIWRVIKGGWLFDPDKLRPSEAANTSR